MAVQDIANYTFKDTFSLSVVKFDKACVINKPEQIDAYNIYWIKEGKGNYAIDFRSYSFDGSVLFFLTPGQVFTIDSEKVKEAYKLSFVRDFYCIETHDNEISCNGVLFNNIYETPFVKPSDKDIKKLELIIENLIDEFKNENKAQYDMLQSLLKQFIILSVRIKNASETIKDDSETKLFKDFSLLIERNYKTMHSVTEYAARLGLSPKSLTKHLHRIKVVSPSELIKNRIILEAKRQLIYSDDSVKQIAYGLGFNDPAYFTRFFTKVASKSPLQFKKDYKN